MIDLLQKHPFFKDKNILLCEPLKTQGYCNENYLVMTEDQKYIVRKFLHEDIDRKFEYQVHTLAFEQGIAPEPFCLDIENSIMISAFLEGTHKKTVDRADLGLLANTLKILHRIKLDSEPVKLQVQKQSLEVQEAFEAIAEYDREFVLCHNDLNPQNIFFAKDTKLIDWEYASVNDRYFDLASVCVEFALDDTQEASFLKAYFENEKYIIQKLNAYKTIYIVLCKQWFESILR